MNEKVATPEAVSKTAMIDRKNHGTRRDAPPPRGDAVYGLGMVGALVYFLGTATSGREKLLALGKASVWPALLVHKAFKVLGG